LWLGRLIYIASLKTAVFGQKWLKTVFWVIFRLFLGLYYTHRLKALPSINGWEAPNRLSEGFFENGVFCF
jgi:hypothetical protein